MNWTHTDKNIIKKYCRPIVHMRRQVKVGRFSLVFGTGLTQPLGIPGWHDLNISLAEDSRVEGKALLGRPTADTINRHSPYQNHEG